jgi:TRAP transporter TAXI family solute receptor
LRDGERIARARGDDTGYLPSPRHTPDHLALPAQCRELGNEHRTARAVLKAAGLSYGDFGKVEYLPFGESVELMKNRQLDVTLQSAGLGVASIRDLATAVKIVVVSIPTDVVAKVGDAAYQPMTIPANTYTGQTEAVPSIAIKNFLVSHEGVPADAVYAMTKAMFENLDTLIAAHSAGKGISKDGAVSGTSVTFHPGAAKYYREVGLMK